MIFFLNEIAKHLYSTYGEDLKNLCVVFPGRRAGLFFKKYLSDLIKKPIWSPVIYTISDLMSLLSDFDKADDLYTIFELYEIYCQEKKNAEKFDDFYFWGEIMLADFDEIDKYLVNASDLFKNISELKTIEQEFSYLTDEQIQIIQRFWKSFTPERQSRQKSEFLNTWEILYKLYYRLKENLALKNLGYEGMIYRRVVEKLDKDGSVILPYTKIFFIGFNALNECEKRLFKYLASLGLAEFYWDYDDYYVNNKNHEAGRFIRSNLQEFEQANMDIPNNTLLTEKDIQIISVPSDTGQARLLSSILSGFENTSHETAIVLADENLLLPVLYSLPESIDEFNITMGYPVNETPVYSLIEHIIDLQRNCRRYHDGQWRFYYQDVLALLNHPSVFQSDKPGISQIIEEIKKRNKIYIIESELISNPLLRTLFIKIEDSSEIPDYLLRIFEAIATYFKDQDSQHRALENEIIFQLYIKIKRLNEILKEKKVSLQVRTLFRLLRKIIMNTRIPFSGEPLTGLQIMGVLETRTLDFRNLVLLSMNEGIFPSISVSHSFIPHHLRTGFNLTTLEYQDAIYAYYFYRLIQKAEKIVLVYNSKTEGLTAGEKSRYLYQLIFDPQFSVRETVVTYSIRANPENPVEVKKDNRVMGILGNFISGSTKGKYISPSALNTFMDCSLRFYFRYIAALEEPQEVTEEVDQLLLGKLLHAAINKLYEPFVSGDISDGLLNGLIENKQKLDSAIKFAFSKEYQHSGNAETVIIEGRNVIIREILAQYLILILRADKLYVPFRILDMEREYLFPLPVKVENKTINVIVGGKIDRIDKTGEEVRILDYKTGKVERRINHPDDLFDFMNKNRNRPVFQTFMYAKLFHLSGNDPGIPVVPGLYTLREIGKEDFDYHILVGPSRNEEILRDYRPVDEEFTSGLVKIVENIFNPATAFYPTDIRENCIYCSYREICHR